MQTLTHETIVKAVQTWPTAHRLKLVQEILSDLTDSAEFTPKQTAERAFGLISKHSNRPIPTDDEIEQWLVDERCYSHHHLHT
ncbi:MAG: hypothetical protein H6658_06120 [Ardenticatenaceae bacterium]|nr:hypothetical protein [Ardenticatenaceae bacterium]